MPSDRFYCPTLIAGVNELPPEEAHHAVHVMRCRSGESIELFDGKGQVASGIIEQVSKRKVTVRIEALQSVPFDLRHRLTLAVAMSKAHRQGYLVEKCTELGVAAIWPIIAAHSVTRPGEAAVEKWSRRAIEAAKQSDRAWVPDIAPVGSFAHALGRASEFSIGLICDLADDAVPIQYVLEKPATGGVSGGTEKRSIMAPGSIRLEPGPRRQSTMENSIIAFVGPEGGWTDDERQAARSAGLTSVSLSPTILRAETAAVAICAVVAAGSFLGRAN